MIGIGREIDGLYILKNHITPTFGAVIKDEDSQRLWHLWLGHPSIGVMKILKHKVDDGMQQECVVCPLAKQFRLKFLVSTSKSTSLFELVHLDVWGPH